MTKVPPIRDVMMPNPQTIDLFETASAAEKIMRSRGFHHLPVVDGRKIYGVISDRDIAVARRSFRGDVFDGKVLVKDICLEEPLTVKEDEALDAIAALMIKNKVDVVVITKNDEPVGIFTTTDACRYIAGILKPRNEGGLWSKLLGA
jgi:acetoin utilization protein AcuB